MTIARSVRIMGILNVTPDSFSDGGNYFDSQAAFDQVRRLIDDGADIIDVGGESTRPYAEPVMVKDELGRVIPIIESIRSFSDITVSIDTTKAEVARQALRAGADIINDVSALRNDPGMIDLVRKSDAELIIMHMKGTPGTMQDSPHYQNVVEEVLSFFRQRLDFLEAEGIDLDRVIIDPGIGFGKKLEHNLRLLNHLERLSELGRPVLLGHSRKRFLGDLTGLEADQRDAITSVVSALSVEKNVSIFRVHDVAATRVALEVAKAIRLA
ncbi:MAG: dihydropteroate synthase [Desulfofustis sp.]|nr:dihydropteroate synthase [Desulfofustis sp.]NNF46748.1 dihydropteroate synthase [Desulfofustis sp.]NNK57311.1 dihydropteroate synthase [Desulfofustis sp.]